MKYPVYPEPDGYDRPINPYGDHIMSTPLPVRGMRTKKNKDKRPPKKYLGAIR